jgi:recombination protein RecA
MSIASAVRIQIEAALANRIPSALTPVPRLIRPVSPTGIASVDSLLDGGLPVGATTEMVGPQCSGRTSLTLSFLARITQAGCVVAWIDACDELDPESVAAAGIDLSRLLWVRCGVASKPIRQSPAFQLPEKYFIPPAVKKGLHGGGHGAHPRTEVKGLSEAVGGLLHTEAITACCAEPQRRSKLERKILKPEQKTFVPVSPFRAHQRTLPIRSAKPLTHVEQAIRTADLLLHAGGFAAIVLDMACVAPEHALRVPLATWFRYRAAAERTCACLLLLTPHSCAKSSAELLLRFHAGHSSSNEATVFTGIEHRVEVERRRFASAVSNVVPMRKLPQRENGAGWRSHATWAGAR